MKALVMPKNTPAVTNLIIAIGAAKENEKKIFEIITLSHTPP